MNHLVEAAKADARKTTRAATYTPSEAARALGVAPVTLKRWRQQGLVTPSLMYRGVNLYTGTDLKVARRQINNTTRSGPQAGFAATD